MLSTDETYSRTALETLEELDWCLDMLESMQTHKSVSDLAKYKVRMTQTNKDTEGLAGGLICKVCSSTVQRFD